MATSTGPEASSTTASPDYIEEEEDIDVVKFFDTLVVIEAFGTLVPPLPKEIKFGICHTDSDSGFVTFDYKDEIGSDYAEKNELCFLSDRVLQTFDGGQVGVGDELDGPDKSLFFAGDSSALPNEIDDNSTRIAYTKFHRSNYSDEEEPVDSVDMVPSKTRYLSTQSKIYNSLKTFIDPLIQIERVNGETSTVSDVKNPDTIFSKFIRFDKL